MTDTPTALQDPIVHDALTHPASRVVGRRFQGTRVSDGETRVFDVRPIGSGRSELVAVYG